jgi:phosphatidylglycerol lysyltransferase
VNQKAKNMKFPFSSKIVKNTLSLALAGVMLWFAFHFLTHKGVQLSQIKDAIEQANAQWLYLGIAVTLLYILLHAEMYRLCFNALGLKVGIGHLIRLYLKRNTVGVFLPAGFISSQAFFNKEITQLEGIEDRDVLSASGMYTIAGLVSIIIVVVPALGWMLTKNLLPAGSVEAFLTVSALLFGLLFLSFNFVRHGKVYQLTQKYLPHFTAHLDGLDWSRFQGRFFTYAILVSILVEISGILHVYIAARALGVESSFSMAFAGYVSVLIVLMTSPFLKGVGAVEALLAMVCMHFGCTALQAISIAVLYRFFEFWLVLALSVPMFLFRSGSLLLRIAPPLLLFLLGVVNILSGLTPMVADRSKILLDYIPWSTIHASNALIVSIGFVLLFTAFYLFRGLRSAWWLALGLSSVSLLSHLTKGLDYEEAFFALLTISTLVYQRKAYNGRTDFQLARQGWIPALIVIATIVALGSMGFFLLDHQHFGADFTLLQSLVFAVQTYLLMDAPFLHPLTAFGFEFLGLMHFLGGLTLLFICYALFRPLLPRFQNEDLAHERAVSLVKEHGCSSLDYFKTYRDKQFFFPKSGDAFIAYKNTSHYALALENPVAPNEVALRASVLEFDAFCRKNGLQSVYYRIPEASAEMYRSMGKFLLPLGQEAVVNLTNFNLDGKEKKAIRNVLNKMEREGYKFTVCKAPLASSLLQQLRAVSDEWLRMLQRSEMSFSQGYFNEEELKNQTILTLDDADGKIFAFINLIPGASPSEANFDLMRRTTDAPHGTMDFLFAHMFLYLKTRNFQTCNLGLVPMSGVENPGNLSENLLKLAYERIPRFANYRSLRFFKEKFMPSWETKYVAYTNQMDLINLPFALGQIIKS